MPSRSSGAAATLALLGQVGGVPALGAPPAPAVHVRLSQVGLNLEDTKTAVALATGPLPDRFSVLDEAGRRVHDGAQAIQSFAPRDLRRPSLPSDAGKG